MAKNAAAEPRRTPPEPEEVVPDYTVVVGLSRSKLPDLIDEHVTLTRRLKEIKERLDILKTEGEKLFIKAGVKSAMVNGYRVTRVESHSSKLDKAKLFKLGGQKVMGWLQQATVITPFSTLKVTAPKAQEDDE